MGKNSKGKRKKERKATTQGESADIYVCLCDDTDRYLLLEECERRHFSHAVLLVRGSGGEATKVLWRQSERRKREEEVVVERRQHLSHHPPHTKA